MPKVLNMHHNVHTPEDVYIGRGSIWGNPYVIGRDGTREEVINKYRERLLTAAPLRSQLHLLRDKNLVCYCAPLMCHGDVLLELANK